MYMPPSLKVKYAAIFFVRDRSFNTERERERVGGGGGGMNEKVRGGASQWHWNLGINFLLKKRGCPVFFVPTFS